MRVPLFDFEGNIVQILRLADADLAEGCSSRYSRASRAQTLVPQINVKGLAERAFRFRKAKR